MGSRGVGELEAEIRSLRAQIAHHEKDAVGNTAAFLAAVLEAVPAFVVRADADLRLLYVNRVQPGVAREAVLGTSLLEFADEAHRETTRANVTKVLETGTGVTFTTEGVGPDGTTVPYDAFVEPILEADGRRGVCMVLFDVSSTRLRERALRESENKLRLALDASGVALWSWSPRTGVVEWDPRMHEIIGRDVPLDLTAYIEQVVHPDDRKLVAGERTAGLTPGPWESVVHRIVQPSGAVRWVMARGFTVAGEDGEIERIYGGTVDVTEQQKLEEQVRHAQRVDALGQLTAGVAHNFNNLLTVITSNLELLALRGHGEDELIDEARNATLRAAELVRQLMTFAGQRPHFERRSNAIGPLVQRSVEMCRQTFARHVTVTCAIEEGLPPVICNEGEIEQIVMNLLLNARDAVLDSGRAASRISVRVHRTTAASRARADVVRVEVRDDGAGMSEEVLARVFDPFFTTKPPGQGTGLGLATSYAIARELGGQLGCTSVAGAGSTFELFLPASAQPVAEARGASSRPSGRGRVLLIDDELSIRRVLVMLLKDAGFAAVAEETGERGLARLASEPPFDVVLLDRSMPGAPGETFVSRIRELSPASKIILFSGQLVEPALAAKVDDVVIKPVSTNELVATIITHIPPRAPDQRA